MMEQGNQIKQVLGENLFNQGTFTNFPKKVQNQNAPWDIEGSHVAPKAKGHDSAAVFVNSNSGATHDVKETTVLRAKIGIALRSG